MRKSTEINVYNLVGFSISDTIKIFLKIFFQNIFKKS